jgi:hypothetical protein
LYWHAAHTRPREPETRNNIPRAIPNQVGGNRRTVAADAKAFTDVYISRKCSPVRQSILATIIAQWTKLTNFFYVHPQGICETTDVENGTRIWAPHFEGGPNRIELQCLRRGLHRRRCHGRGLRHRQEREVAACLVSATRPIRTVTLRPHLDQAIDVIPALDPPALTHCCAGAVSTTAGSKCGAALSAPAAD